MSSIPAKLAKASIRRINDVNDRAQMWYKKHQEIKKYKDPRRVKIYESISLTKEQIQSIDDIYISNYGKKIPYTWHRHYTAFTGKFDPRYFPELLYIPEFERFCNLYHDFVTTFCDKNLLPYIAKSASVEMPQSLLTATRGFIKDYDNHPISLEHATQWLATAGEVFVKPSIHTGSGVGCALLQMEKGIDQLSGKTAAEILRELGRDFTIQNRIICSDDVQMLHKESCNTFRVVTYRWKNSIKYMPIIMRIGRSNNHIDNAHAGGIFIGVKDDGSLTDTAFTEFNEKYFSHPDSNIVFAKHRINGVDRVIEAAKNMHCMLPQLGLVNWDFTIDEHNSPVLIEANTRGGGIWLLEISHGIGPIGNNTEEVLRWMREMKKRKASEREEIAFGNV